VLEREDQQREEAAAESLSRESVVEFKKNLYRRLNINKYTHSELTTGTGLLGAVGLLGTGP